jgi:NAD(P)-dependent dehydrogenase (short-subunit alcohol dehydrogenase family)
VNCAGISDRGRVVGREGTMAQADFARVVTVNLIGTFLVCRAAATVMQHNDPEGDGERGVIVNTASIAEECNNVFPRGRVIRKAE